MLKIKEKVKKTPSDFHTKVEASSSVTEVHVLNPKLVQEPETHNQNITKEKKPKKSKIKREKKKFMGCLPRSA